MKEKAFDSYNKGYMEGYIAAKRKYESMINAEHRFIDLYVLDKHSHKIHKVGTDPHDSLCIGLGEVSYYNLQNGDGGRYRDTPNSGYVILNTQNGMFTDEYGEIMDERYPELIRKFIEENNAAGN